MSINIRIGELIKHTNTSRSELSEAMEASKQYISGLLTGRNSVGLKIVKFLLGYYPHLNANWLILGKGPMFLNEDDLEKVNEEREAYHNIREKYYELLEENRQLRIEIEKIKGKKS